MAPGSAEEAALVPDAHVIRACYLVDAVRHVAPQPPDPARRGTRHPTVDAPRNMRAAALRLIATRPCRSRPGLPCFVKVSLHQAVCTTFSTARSSWGLHSRGNCNSLCSCRERKNKRPTGWSST